MSRPQKLNDFNCAGTCFARLPWRATRTLEGCFKSYLGRAPQSPRARRAPGARFARKPRPGETLEAAAAAALLEFQLKAAP